MPALFYYSPSAPIKSYGSNPVCQSYLGSNCVAMASGVTDDWWHTKTHIDTRTHAQTHTLRPRH